MKQIDKIAIIDADLIAKRKQRFPNLALMKLSGYQKSIGNEVVLKLDYGELSEFSHVFIGKVFTDSAVPEEVLTLSHVSYGGTGFFFDKAPNLPPEIEHSFPDYHLYDEFVKKRIAKGEKRINFKHFVGASIGFLTRGCFRKCGFCVNKKYDSVFQASPLLEFWDKDRDYLIFLDDNFLAFGKWRELLTEVKATNKRFMFNQALDIRLLTDEKAKELATAKYYGDYTFSFDNIEERTVIEQKFKLWREYCKKSTKLYLFCAYDREDKYDEAFWQRDVVDIFRRIEILMKYDCLGYVMRFEKYKESPCARLYTNIARWVNQPNFYKKVSYREFCHKSQVLMKTDKVCAAMESLQEYEKKYPELSFIFDTKYPESPFTYDTKHVELSDHTGSSILF